MWYLTVALCAALHVGRRPPGVFGADLKRVPILGTLSGSAVQVSKISEVRLAHAGAAKIQKKIFFDFEAGTHTVASPEDGASGSGVAMAQPTDVGAHDASKIPHFAPFFPLGDSGGSAGIPNGNLSPPITLILRIPFSKNGGMVLQTLVARPSAATYLISILTPFLWLILSCFCRVLAAQVYL